MTARGAAFSLLEVLVATALGLMIVSAAYVAVRSAATAAATCQTLATQNAMIRAGMLAALDEVDSWRCYDDPVAGRVRLRGVDVVADPDRALPFTPFRDIAPKAGWTGGDADRGWDKDYAWPAADPRTWWRGDGLENSYSDLRFGRYAMFSARTSPIALPAIALPDTYMDIPGPGGKSLSAWPIAVPDYGAVDVPHTWLANQAAMAAKLGFYGMAEYLPLNATYAWYEELIPYAPNRNAWQYTNLGGIPMVWLAGAGTGFQLSRNRGMPPMLFSIEENTVAPTPYNAFTRTWNTAALARAALTRYVTGYLLNTQLVNVSGQNLIKKVIDESFAEDALLPVRPAHWPAVEVIVHRGLFRRRFNTYCRVSWTNAVTGETAQIDFSAFGTSLRGARQARGLDDY
ncbi:MAG TPA: hypothetical protein VEL07_10785 [Planctomycetota bacterium]|nr:hypothetical protein [Planctomycetota bacterium]